MTRPRRSAPGIAFAAVRAGRFHSGSETPDASVPARSTIDIVAVGRRIQAKRRARRALEVVGGAALVAFGFVPRGVVGAALAFAGAALVVRGVTGRSLRGTARNIARALSAHSATSRLDRVDQASWESFPSSDPPAR